MSIHVANYKGLDLDEALQFLASLTQGLTDNGLMSKSDTTPQASATSTPATGSDSPPQATDDDDESILDNMSDCKKQTSIYP